MQSAQARFKFSCNQRRRKELVREDQSAPGKTFLPILFGVDNNYFFLFGVGQHFLGRGEERQNTQGTPRVAKALVTPLFAIPLKDVAINVDFSQLFAIELAVYVTKYFIAFSSFNDFQPL